MAQKTNQPQPQTTPAASEAPEAPMNQPERIVQAVNSGLSLFTSTGITVTETARLKAQMVSEVRQRLAEAVEEARKGGEHVQEAKKLCDTQAIKLLNMRLQGQIKGDELSALLGDIFGLKPKKDGKPGRTPEGLGEDIRKRVVRFVGGFDHIDGREGGAFYDGLPVAEVAPILKQVKDGKLSIWTGYDKLGKVKQEHTSRPKLAFDQRRIAALADALMEEGAADKVRNNPSLIRAYGEVIKALAVIGSAEPAEEAETEVEVETEGGEQMAA